MIEKLKKINFKQLHNDFIELLTGAENIVLNDDLNAPAPAQETKPEPAPAAPADNTPARPEEKTTEKAPATPAEPTTENKPAPVPDPDINNAINIIDNNYKYTIIAGPHNRYDVIAQTSAAPLKMFSIAIDAGGRIQVYISTTTAGTRRKIL